MKKIIALLLVFLLVGCAKEKEVKDYYIYVTDSNLSTFLLTTILEISPIP